MYLGPSMDPSIEMHQTTESREIQTSQVDSNTACTQTSLPLYLSDSCQQTSTSESVGLNLEFTNLEQDVYFTSQDINVGNSTIGTGTSNTDYYQIGTQYSNTGIDFMTQTNMEFPGVTSSCQTDDLYFNSFSNGMPNNGGTNSIQTQTAGTSYNSDMGGIDTITQTEQTNQKSFYLDKWI